MKKRKDEELCRLAYDLYERVRAHANLREDDIGIDLAYLMGVLLSGNPNRFINLEGHALLPILQRNYPANSPIWPHIQPVAPAVEADEELLTCEYCDGMILPGEARSSCLGSMHEACFEEHQGECSECEGDFV